MSSQASVQLGHDSQPPVHNSIQSSALVALKETLASLAGDPRIDLVSKAVQQPRPLNPRLVDLCQALTALVQGNHFLARVEAENGNNGSAAGLEEL
jgi:hypothetical protein